MFKEESCSSNKAICNVISSLVNLENIPDQTEKLIDERKMIENS